MEVGLGPPHYWQPPTFALEQPWGITPPYWVPTPIKEHGIANYLIIFISNSQSIITAMIAFVVVKTPPLQRLHLKSIAIHV